MSRSLALPLLSRPDLRPLLAAGAIALGGLAVGLVAAQLLLSPPSGELFRLAAYFTAAGAGSLAAGRLLLALAERSGRLSLRMRVAFGAFAGGLVALTNVAMVAALMFVSIDHDFRLLLAIIAFSVVVGGVFSLWAATSIARGVESITDSVRALSQGAYAIELPVTGKDEIGALARDVRALAERLQAADAQRAALDRERRELTAAVSHDLRTPLASVRAMIEALDDGVVRDPDEVSRYHASIRHETERLNRMLDDLLELARADAGVTTLTRAPLAVQEIAGDVVAALGPLAERHGVALTLESEGEPPAIAVDGARVERALANLVRNAIEYTPARGHVDVRVWAEPRAIATAVEDSGPGIPPDEQDRVWDRFYRGERSRTRSFDEAGGGAGLGLAIVRGFVEAHGGSVALESSEGAGARCTMRLPRPPD